ncbi:conserved repeat domain-containing protein [Plantibacter flavus]|uniref:Putative repeat protein (TIGR01451 family) n=1 Tax=Plantibacter flavus TaxID=150123 RepID=A0A3N2BYN0_9MICO|nr:leucine-rich repeat domain-containing protein [Plantibacter flavus]ROR80164.1 putative repeat protein (TIGR01451 family) [Plantibacter flavus]SMG50671.1 conserved repeat domain-containing protein [Plantibacter flavus]
MTSPSLVRPDPGVGAAPRRRLTLLLRSIGAVAIGAVAVGVTATPAHAADAQFADANLNSCVQQALGLPSETPVSEEQAATLTTLRCGTTVDSLDGIESLTNLESLALSRAPLSAGVEPLASLTSITSLSLTGTSNLDMSIIGGMTQLTSLNIGSAPLTDLSALATLVNLTTLGLNAVGATDLSPLSGLSGLEALSVKGNRLTTVAPLSTLTRLHSLEVATNQIADITPLASLTRLQNLNLLSNQIEDLTPLRGLTGLRTLNAQLNQVSDAGPLSTLTRLTSLALDDNRITDLTPFIPLTALEILTINDNLIEDVTPLRDLVFIETLEMSGNRISSIAPLAGLVATNYVRFDRQVITLPEIAVGAPQENPIRSIDGSAAPVTSTTAQYDAASNTWTFAAAGNNSLTWMIRDIGIGSWSPFSGRITQRSVATAGSLELAQSMALGETGTHPAPGDTVTHTYTLRSAGTATVSDISITDTTPNLSGFSFDWPAAEGVLTPGQVATATATSTLTQIDIDAMRLDSSATATGAAASSPVVSNTAPASLPIDGLNGISVAITADIASVGEPAAVGDSIGYAIIATNTGTRTLTETSVVASLPELSALLIEWPGAAGVLAPGEQVLITTEYAITAADIEVGSVTNEATASGTGPDGADVDSSASVAVELRSAIVTPGPGPDPSPEPTPTPEPTRSPAPGTVEPAPGTSSGDLAKTGVDGSTLTGLTLGAMLLFGIGAAVLAETRRRSRVTQGADRNE